MALISSLINKVNPYNYYKKYYYLRLDGYYFDTQKQTTMVVICLKNKRAAEVLPVNNVIFDSNYFHALHQLDCCLLGILANNERSCGVNLDYIGTSNIKQVSKINCLIKQPPLLEIARQFVNQNNEEFIVLKSKHTNKLLSINVLNLVSNEEILSNLSQIDALSIGYTASNAFLKVEK
jgi:hypothetical protein